MTILFLILLLSYFNGLVYSHGSMNLPLPRNNRGYFPIDTEPGESNGPSCLGQACGWFGAGCFIGCDRCSNASSGAEVPSYPSMDYSTDWDKCQPLNPTLPDYARTYNIKKQSYMGDWTATHPWRAPGRAPMGDSCGNAGAYYIGPGVEGYPPMYPGTLIPEGPIQAVWKRGGIAEASWSLWSNHGGGYQYRLCPNDGKTLVNEDCFTSHVMKFATNQTIIRSPYGKFEDFEIPAVDVSEGTYPADSTWRMNPIPACNCDKGYNCTIVDDPTIYTAYEDEKGDGVCKTGYQFKPLWTEGYGYWGSGAHWTGDSLEWAIVDQLQVSKEMKPGKYIFQWRWDAESSPQIWGNCADIEII